MLLRTRIPILMAFFGSIGAIFPHVASATATHLGTIELELKIRESSGKESKLTSTTAQFRLDWMNGKCEIEWKGAYVYCVLDTTQDLKDKDGDVIVKQMPVAIFQPKMIDLLTERLAKEDTQATALITGAVSKLEQSPRATFVLPFYTCERCEKVKGKTPVWDVFRNYVQKTISYSDGSGELKLQLKLHKMKAVPGVFNTQGAHRTSR